MAKTYTFRFTNNHVASFTDVAHAEWDSEKPVAMQLFRVNPDSKFPYKRPFIPIATVILTNVQYWTEADQ
jgi:hypothetical protein